MMELATLAILLVLSGFFSGSETALTAISPARVDALAAEGRMGARSLHRLKSDVNRMLIIILIGNNLVNTASAAIATVVATEHFGHLGPGLAVGAITLLLLVFGEITPKTFGVRYTVSFALLAAPTLDFLGRILFPLVWLLRHLTHWMHSLTAPPSEPSVTEDELISMAEHATVAGAIDEDEHEMIRRIFDFGTLRASDIMVPRHQVFSLDGRRPIGELLPEILAQPYARIPLHAGNPDEINRVVYLREILAEVAAGHLDKPLESAGHDPLFVPANQPVDVLFDVLRGNKQRLIIVVNEFGELQGLFTLEDIVEELVGEIYDDMDSPHPHLVRAMEGEELLVDGTTELRVLEAHFDRDLTGKPTDSVNLWVLNHVQRIPAPGERFVIEGLEVRVERGSRRRINELRVGLYHPVEKGAARPVEGRDAPADAALPSQGEGSGQQEGGER